MSRATYHTLLGTLGSTIAVTSIVGPVGSAQAFFPGDVKTSGVEVRTLHEAGAPVFLLAAGEIDASHAGLELLAVVADGTILRLDSNGGAWDVQPLSISVEPSPFMHVRPTLNIGDVHPGFAGNEIVVETGNTVNVLVQVSPGVWQRQIVLDGGKFFGVVWGVRIGDIDPGSPGQELFYITESAFDVSSGYFARLVNGEWRSEYIFGAEVGMDSAIGDSDPARPGNEIVVTTEMGPTYEVAPEPESALEWPRRTLWDDYENAGWTVRIADIRPDLPGNEIAYGTRYNDRLLLSRRAGAGHAVDVVLTGEATEATTMWDIAVGDVAPATPSLEIVGVDNLGLAYMAEFDGAAWNGRNLWRDERGALYAAVIADFLPGSPRPEIAVAGESGAITLLAGVGDCRADFDGDGFVTGIDYDLYVVAFEAGEATADFDGDGFVTGVDFDLYVGAYEAGC